MKVTIEGTAIVWANEYNGKRYYSVSVGSKDQEGNWMNAKQPVRFKSGVKVNNKTEIDFKAFPTVSKGKDGNFVLWQITEYRETAEHIDVPVETQYSALTNDDIPF